MNNNTNSKSIYEQKRELLEHVLFWNVDTQYDFMRSDESFPGALAVAGAREIEGNLERLTGIAKQYGIKVVNTADWHTLNDKEINAINPDFKNTYPPHCMAFMPGANYVPATSPENPYIIPQFKSNDFNVLDKSKIILNYRNLVLHKNKFDVFAGNENTDDLLDVLNPEKVIVYGVATNVCVDAAVVGLLRRKKDVYVVLDAIKELPKEIARTPLEDVLQNWKDRGAKFVKTNELYNLLQ